MSWAGWVYGVDGYWRLLNDSGTLIRQQRERPPEDELDEEDREPQR